MRGNIKITVLVVKKTETTNIKKIKHLSQGFMASYCKAERRTGLCTMGCELLKGCVLSTGKSVDRQRIKNKMGLFSQLCSVERPEACGENVSIANSQASGRRCGIPLCSHCTAACLSCFVLCFHKQEFQCRATLSAKYADDGCAGRSCT